MASDLLRPPTSVSESEALRRSQQAPAILEQRPWPMPWPISLITTSDAPEKWTIYENLFYSTMRTGDNASAALALKYLKERFGETNERVMGLVGIFHEATAKGDSEIGNVLEQYNETVDEQPINMAVRKRRIALMRSIGKTELAIRALVALVEASPTDAEAWAELADLYFGQAMYSQAIYSLEEVLLVTPNAWNIHARLGEVLYVSAQEGLEDSVKVYARAMQCFCRSVELCDDYLRGYYGLKLTTNTLQPLLSVSKGVTSKDAAADKDIRIPSLSIVQKLNELATSKLGEIIRKHSTNQKGWGGYDEAEIIASRELLDRDSSKAPR